MKSGTGTTWWIALACAVGCGDKSGGEGSTDGGSEVGDVDASASEGGSGGTTTGTVDESGGGSAGQCAGMDDQVFYDPPGECYNNSGCDTCNCLTWTDNPPDPAATCVAPGPAGEVHVTATLFEFPGMTPLPNLGVEVFNALDLGLGGFESAMPIAMGTSDADGRFETTLTPTDQIGIVAVVRNATGYVSTATGLAKFEMSLSGYESSNAIHDLFVISQADVDVWNAALMGDAEVAAFLPLGENGGDVGVARSRYTGEPVVGARIVSLTNGDQTGAIVRYLNEDGMTFNPDATTSTGVYVLVNPDLAEEFEAEIDGQILSTRANKAGSGAGGIFTMNLTINLDPGMDPFP